MASKLEIRLKKELFDAEGAKICKNAKAYFGLSIDEIRVIRILMFDINLTKEQKDKIKTDLFTNPVTEDSSWQPIADQFDWVLWVGLRPGVKDNAGGTAVEAIQDLLNIKLKEQEGVYTSKLYEIKGNLSKSQVELVANKLLANDLIQQWSVYSRADWNPDEGIGDTTARVMLNHIPNVTTFNIESNHGLKHLSEERHLALQTQDIPIIRKYFLRPDIIQERKSVGLDLPTDIELEYISQARSDHCNHNTFQGKYHYKDLHTGEEFTIHNLFKEYIKNPTIALAQKNPWVVSVLWDNAGIAKFDENYNYVITGETHNSPSNMEAYGGAITGIVGIFRDPLGTGKGSKLIMGMYDYCVAPYNYEGPLSPHLHPRRLLDGVIEGVKDGGNKSGIPTCYGLLIFDECYLGKCLVFVTALGIIPTVVDGTPSHEKTTSPGELIIMCGGRVGKDGIHGVTASSQTYGEHTPAGHVQIGDPYTQKKMHDFILEARDEGLIPYITDNGGGGLSSSIGESARLSNGARVDLDKVPLKYDGLNQWEIWISESQERMTLAVKPEHLARLMELSEKHAVESTVVGEYNNSGYLKIDYKGHTCAYVRLELLESDFPPWEFDAEWISPIHRGLTEPVYSEPVNHNALLSAMLKRPNLCARNWVQRQYDHEVQGGSVIKPLVGVERDIPSDGAVIRPVLSSNKGVAVSQAINPWFSKIDTYYMTVAVIDEAVRKIIALGGDPEQIGGIDNFCWPTIQYDQVNNPDGKYKAAQLVRSNMALKDCCLAFGIPLLSGKDSMYVDGDIEGPFGERRKVSGLPTLLFTASSIVNDIRFCTSMDFKSDSDLIYIIGETKNELGGSEFYSLLNETGLNIPVLDVNKAFSAYKDVADAIKNGLVASCHAIGRGGLGVHLALSVMAGNLGASVNIEAISGNTKLRPSCALYSESLGRFLITVSHENKEFFEKTISNCNMTLIGKVTESPNLKIHYGENLLIDMHLSQIKKFWISTFKDMTV